MTTYFNGAFSPNCFKTKILLNELGIEVQQVDFERGEFKRSEYAPKFPFGTVPALEDNGAYISESGAIAIYLAEKHQKLMPEDSAARALMWQALNLESANVGPIIGGRGIFGEMGKPEEKRNQERLGALMGEVQALAHRLSAVLGERAYFAGDFSIADIQLFPALAKSVKAGLFQEPPANLVRWTERMWQRPSVKKAAPEYIHFRG